MSVLATKVKNNIVWLLVLTIFTIKTILVITTSPPIEIWEAIIASKILFLTPLNLRLLGLFIFFVSALTFGVIVKNALKLKKQSRLIIFISFLVFFLSPWENAISTFYIVQNLLILLSLLAAYFFPKKILLVLTVLVIITVIYLKGIYSDYFFAGGFSPKNLSSEINEKQNLIYLSVNKKFMLPNYVRKAVYNKPLFAIDKVVSHAISFFDFEQLSFPFDSYAITRLSGLSPKGNLPIFFAWEIPLIVYGAYQIIKQKTNFNRSKFFVLLCISFVPFMLFEKKIMLQSSFLLLPSFAFIEIVGVYTIFSKYNNLKKFKVICFLGLFIVLYFLTGYFRLFYFNYLSYQTSHPSLFKEISLYISENNDAEKNYVVTTRFGPTDLMVSYYLNRKLPKNISFRSFNLKDEVPQKNTYYIGLAGEFVGTGKDLDQRPLPKNIKLVRTIEADEETVFNYGKDLWITYIEK